MATDKIYVFNGSSVGDFLENSAKIIFAETDMTADIIDGYFSVKMRADISDC